MKTSFYFVIWIIIYPLLGLFHSPALSQNSFIVALLIVWGLSWLLNRSMPDTLRYEAALTRVSLMELLYSGNISVASAGKLQIKISSPELEQILSHL